MIPQYGENGYKKVNSLGHQNDDYGSESQSSSRGNNSREISRNKRYREERTEKRDLRDHRDYKNDNRESDN
jgi:hypothetical protein